MNNQISICAPPSLRLAGVDGCRAGWFAIVENLACNSFEPVITSSFDSLLEELADCALIAVDIPIGLPNSGPRTCDLLARKYLSPKRGSSVFPAPIRPVLGASTHKDASEIRRSIEGKGVSIQSFAISKKIREVDNVLRGNREIARRVVEIHPEVSFAAMASGIPMLCKKARTAGHHERVEHLRHHVPIEAIDFGLAAYALGAVAKDDILDAFAALWTARRIRAGTACHFPPTAETDPYGLDMAIWY